MVCSSSALLWFDKFLASPCWVLVLQDVLDGLAAGCVAASDFHRFKHRFSWFCVVALVVPRSEDLYVLGANDSLSVLATLRQRSVVQFG